MNIIFSLIFVFSLAGGWAWAHFKDFALAQTLVCMVTAGFIGSCLIALVFSYLYFWQQETDREKIQRLKQEINELKQVKKIEQ